MEKIQSNREWERDYIILLKFYNYKVLKQPLFHSKDRKLHEPFKIKIIFYSSTTLYWDLSFKKEIVLM